MAGLFGARRPMLTDIQIPQDAPAPFPVAAAPQRRGFFGRLGNAATPRNLMVVGATLQELGGRRGALGQQMSALQEQAQAEWERRRAEQQDAWQAEQQGRQRNIWSAQDRIAASAPPEQRDLVTADPGAFIAQRGARDQYQWQRQYDNQNPEAITPYQQAQLDLTRRGQNASASGVRAPPAGYRWTPEGNLEAVPGGPADIRATAAGQAQQGRLESSASSLQNALTVLDEALPNVSGRSAGLWGQMTRGYGGTAAYDLEQQLEPVLAILSFENLAEMRRNSETGGALGSIAVRELDLLGRTIRSLDTAQSPEQLQRAIVATRGQLARTLSAVQNAQREAGGVPTQQQQAPSAGAAAPAAATNDPLGIR